MILLNSTDIPIVKWGMFVVLGTKVALVPLVVCVHNSFLMQALISVGWNKACFLVGQH